MKRFIGSTGIDELPDIGETIVCVTVSYEIIKAEYEEGMFDRIMVVKWFRPEDIQ